MERALRGVLPDSPALAWKGWQTRAAEKSAAIRVAVVDPYPLFRLGVVQSIGRCNDLVVVGEGTSAADARRIVREARLDVLVFEIGLPDAGLETVQDLARSRGRCKLAVLTALDAPLSVAGALWAGVNGYILKGISGSELAAVIRLIHSGQAFVSPELAFDARAEARGGPGARTPTLKPTATFSQREQQLLTLVSQGLTNKEIARQLNLEVGTVKHYVTQLFKKMQVRNRIEAILALQHLRRT